MPIFNRAGRGIVGHHAMEGYYPAHSPSPYFYDNNQDFQKIYSHHLIRQVFFYN